MRGGYTKIVALQGREGTMGTRRVFVLAIFLGSVWVGFLIALMACIDAFRAPGEGFE